MLGGNAKHFKIKKTIELFVVHWRNCFNRFLCKNFEIKLIKVMYQKKTSKDLIFF